MSTVRIRVNLTAGRVTEIIQEFVASWQNRTHYAPLIQAIQLRVGQALLARIRDAFAAKSRGGIGDDGIQWRPLARSTVAKRRVTRAERRQLGITGGMRFRGLLTADQDAKWRRIYVRKLYYMMERWGLGLQEAKVKAAQIAWNELKQDGALTKIGTLGDRHVDILYDTGALLRSLTPGMSENILDAPVGQVIVGTNEKSWHHAGSSKLPARPFWPSDGSLPDPWAVDLLEQMEQGSLQALVFILQGAP